MLHSAAQHIYYNMSKSSRQRFFIPIRKILPSVRKPACKLVKYSVLQRAHSSVIIKVQRGTQNQGSQRSQDPKSAEREVTPMIEPNNEMK